MLVHTWQQALQNAVSDPDELVQLLNLDPAWREKARAAAKLFPLKVPRGFVDRMEKGNPKDPLLLQVLPLFAELNTVEGYVQDALAEAKANPLPGLLHKYHGRVLVTLVGACAVHCRYCFRRHFPYEENNPGKAGWQRIFDYVRGDPTITEVILSGGDPLLASDQTLFAFSEQLASIPHVRRLRIHTRIPIVLPERINDGFINWVEKNPFRPVLVLHCNHPHELNAEVKAILQRLQHAGALLLNQSVLLKGVNDEVEVLAELSAVLIDAGVVPYYLHILDKVQGTAHFDLNLATAKALHADLNKRLSGYMVPKLVQEVPGLPSKAGVLDLFTV